MSTKDFPSPRDIFFKFDFVNSPTTKYTELDKQFSEKLTAAVPQFDKNDEITCLVTESCVEAQATGFEQGFAFAVKLLLNGGNINGKSE